MREIELRGKFVERMNGMNRSEVPVRTAQAATASGSIPSSRKAAIDSAPLRFESPSPEAAVNRLWWPKSGAAPCPAKASKSWIWTAVLVTWSSPRMIWLILRSMSSTTDGRV